MRPQRDERSDRYHALHAKYQELRAQFLALRKLYYLIECAWCQQRIGWKRKTAVVPGETSHSVCLPCAADLVRQLPAMQEALAGAPQPHAVKQTSETENDNALPPLSEYSLPSTRPGLARGRSSLVSVPREQFPRCCLTTRDRVVP